MMSEWDAQPNLHVLLVLHCGLDIVKQHNKIVFMMCNDDEMVTNECYNDVTTMLQHFKTMLRWSKHYDNYTILLLHELVT